MTRVGGNGVEMRLASFRYAFEGIGYALRTQPNTWIHAGATIVVALLAIWLQLPRLNSAILVLAIVLVWTTELINTAVEALVDLAAPDYQPLAKVAKDVSAGAVLVTSIGAMIVGLLLLGPPLWHVLFSS